MMYHFRGLSFTVLTLTCFCHSIAIDTNTNNNNNNEVSDSPVTVLESPIVTDFGRWGAFQNCTSNRLVTAFQLKVEPQNSVDDTALNGIRFFCGNRQIITSSQGDFGEWGNIYSCSGHAVGFQLKSQVYQGFWDDDTAADNLRIICADGTFIEGFQEGEEVFEESFYTTKQECPQGQGICGLQTQVEEYQGIEADDTSLNNLRVKCCSVNGYVDDPPTTEYFDAHQGVFKP